MKKTKSVFIWLLCLCSTTLFAQQEQTAGDAYAAEGNYEGASVMYRICMETNEQCLLKLFKLIYDKKIDAQFTDELYQLINPPAEKGNAEAQYYLGTLYLNGIGGVERDDAKAVQWFQKSAERGFEKAKKDLESPKFIQISGDQYANANEYDKAAAQYRLCKNTNDTCLIKLVQLIYDEKVKPMSRNELFQLLNPLAKKGNAQAQYYMGMLYKKGIGGVRQHYNSASKWFKQSADQGNIEARNELDLLSKPAAPERQTAQESSRQTTPRAKADRPKEAENKVNVVSNATTTVVETPVKKPENPPVRTVDNPVTVVDSPVQRTNQRGKINEQPATEIMNIAPEKRSSGLGNTLLIVGGVALVGGAAATYLLPPTVEEDWSSSNETGTYVEVKKRNPIYLIAGGVVGGICIGTGIVIKAKAKSHNSLLSLDSNIQPLPSSGQHDIMLNFIAVYRGAGLRLTF
ncbi:MAG: sel1 repeat family protein [Tannerella sp.]|jgi:TPR repeat protein|nr:sel1 repeat family protein [Tannerella sp.]